ncbi:MAG: hypothetical protein PHE84_07185 [bacterium]|nr:hypothetical protein [bacterium]
MILKTFSLILILISAPPDSRFQNSLNGTFFQNQKSFSLQNERVRFAEYSGSITKNIESISSGNISKPKNFKSPYLAFALTASAIPVIIGLLANTSNNSSDNELRFLIIPASAILLPIPSHIYVKDSGLKTVGLTVLKLGFWGIMGIGIVASLGQLACMDHPDDCGSNPFPIFIFGAVGLGGIYVYELIDAPLAANRYNEKIQQQQGFYVKPLAWKGEYRLNVGYNF